MGLLFSVASNFSSLSQSLTLNTLNDCHESCRGCCMARKSADLSHIMRGPGVKHHALPVAVCLLQGCCHSVIRGGGGHPTSTQTPATFSSQVTLSDIPPELSLISVLLRVYLMHTGPLPSCLCPGDLGLCPHANVAPILLPGI